MLSTVLSSMFNDNEQLEFMKRKMIMVEGSEDSIASGMIT